MRSRRTLEAILRGTEALLQEKRFEEIGVGDILSGAGCSIGSFYARFGSKDDLLPALYQRYHDNLPAEVDRVRALLASSHHSLHETCRLMVEAHAAFYQGRVNLMRAIVIFARTKPDQLASILNERSELQQQLVKLFEPHFALIRHPRPDEAVRLGLLFVADIVREAVLFPDAPTFAASGLSIATVNAAASRMLFCFLTCQPESSQ